MSVISSAKDDFKGEVEPPLALPSSMTQASSAMAAASATLTQDALERRANWLQEDLQVVKRRAQDILGPVVSTPEGQITKNAGVARLHALANQLLGELAEEREWRDSLEAELTTIESTLLQERSHREKALATLSRELEETMKSLVRRIDVGLVDGTQELNTRAAKTETALKSLIVRVEEGLQSGARALQETLAVDASSTSKGATKPSAPPDAMLPLTAAVLDRCFPGASRGGFAEDPKASKAQMPESPTTATGVLTASLVSQLSKPSTMEESPTNGGRGQGALDSNSDASMTQAAQPLFKVWGELQEENLRLRQKRVQLEARQLRSRLNSRSPTVMSHSGSKAPSHAPSPPAAASKIASPLGNSSRNRSPMAYSMNLGTGFRFRESGVAASSAGMGDEAAATSVDGTPKARQDLGLLLGLGNDKAKLGVLRDSDAASTSSSLPTTVATTSVDGGGGPPSRSSVRDSLSNSCDAVGSKLQGSTVPVTLSSHATQRLGETRRRTNLSPSPAQAPVMTRSSGSRGGDKLSRTTPATGVQPNGPRFDPVRRNPHSSVSNSLTSPMGSSATAPGQNPPRVNNSAAGGMFSTPPSQRASTQSGNCAPIRKVISSPQQMPRSGNESK